MSDAPAGPTTEATPEELQALERLLVEKLRKRRPKPAGRVAALKAVARAARVCRETWDFEGNGAADEDMKLCVAMTDLGIALADLEEFA